MTCFDSDVIIEFFSFDVALLKKICVISWLLCEEILRVIPK